MKNTHYYLLKLARLSGWLLLPLVILYIGTGFVLCGQYGLSRWMAPETALTIHHVFEWPLVVLFVSHTLSTAYFAMRRWGWIKSRNEKCQPASPAEKP